MGEPRLIDRPARHARGAVLAAHGRLFTDDLDEAVLAGREKRAPRFAD